MHHLCNQLLLLKPACIYAHNTYIIKNKQTYLIIYQHTCIHYKGEKCYLNSSGLPCESGSCGYYSKHRCDCAEA
ncbi:hypothetical protein HanIR_Chr02g0084311 [Helianthus annuus]|nr:hypothetical protein HanIR_Chr02g0084311 [Helianthus annuus]